MVADHRSSYSAKFRTLSPLSPCEGNDVACVGDSPAQCVQGYYQRTPCGSGLVYVLPIFPDHMRAVVLMTAQMSSVTLLGFLRDYGRLHYREPIYDAYYRDRVGLYTPSTRPGADFSLSGSSSDLQWV